MLYICNFYINQKKSAGHNHSPLQASLNSSDDLVKTPQHRHLKQITKLRNYFDYTNVF